MKSVIRFFAQRHTLANVFTVSIILLGVSSLTVVQRDNFPRVDFEQVTITTRYPGASPEDVELNVTNKIEEELKAVTGIQAVSSISMENISFIHVRLDPDATDKKKVKTDVRDAVFRTADLPSEVDERPLVEEFTTSNFFPIMEVGITGHVPYRELRELARRIEKELLDVPGVASLTRYGHADREIKVEVSQDAVEKWGIPPHQIVTAIRNRNIRATGGSFESYTSEKNIVTLAQFADPREVEDAIVHATDDGTLIRVSDLAAVRDDFEARKVTSRMNGKPAISFLVFKKESADLIRTVDAIKALVHATRDRLPQGVHIEYSNDASRLVRSRLQVVVTNGVMGLVLVLVVLSAFMDLRSAFWVGMGIPVALLGTLFFLPFFGVYLDSIALGGMILVIGVIVDDGIVIAENIWRQREIHFSPIDAAVQGTALVFKPVLTTILTTVLAFAPMFFMSGIMGDFVFVIPLVVILALSISFLEFTIALPAHLVAGVKPETQPQLPSESGLLARIRKAFGRVLKATLQWRYPVIGAFVLALVVSVWYAKYYLDFVLFPTQSADAFSIIVELPSGSSLERTGEKVRELERLVENLPDGMLDSYVTRIGNHGSFRAGENENWAYVGVYLTPFSSRERNADEIVEDLRHKAAAIVGITKLTFIIESGGPPVGRPITLRIIGSDDDLRKQLAGLLVNRLAAIDGVKDVDRDDKRGKDEIKVDLDYIRLADAGLNVADVARNVRLAYDGDIVTSVRYGDEDVDFRVILEERARKSLEGLTELVIPNSDGRFIRLREIADFRTVSGPSHIYHFDEERSITITADIVKGETTPLEVIGKVLGGIDLDREWRGMRLVVGGEAEETKESMRTLGIAFLTAAVGIYLLLLLLFNSMVQPLLVMAAIPFGLVGVIATFALHQEALSFLALLGVVGLTGIVVNDSLILTDVVNRLRRVRPQEAMRKLVVAAAMMRFRPIILTSITTVAGLLPMAYGVGGSDPFSAPMALAMGYGVLLATPLTLILLPCLLIVVEDVTTLGRRVFKAVSG